jgi:signal transduction histidine kinase
MKIQTKTTLLFTLLTLSVFLVLTATVYYFSNEFAYNDFYKRLELRARIAAKFNFEKDHTNIESFKEIQREYLERLTDEESLIIKLTPAGKPVSQYPSQLPESFLTRIRNANGRTEFYKYNLVHYAGLFYKDESGDFLVIESATNQYGAEIISRLRNILIITLVSAIIIIYSTGLYFSKRTFKPFRTITQHANSISEVNLELRLEETEGTDEVAELARTLNKMLDRLQTAFETQNNFISNASHELRTPLTAIIGEADYALSKEREAAVYKSSLQNVLQQAEKLQHVTKGLLALAKTGFDKGKQHLENIRIDLLLQNVRENVQEIFPQSLIEIKHPAILDYSAPLVFGNPDLLSVAVSNILLNACKYSNNQVVTVEYFIHQQGLAIKITDRGIGIPEKEIRDIKSPFFRASNTREFEGHGIGLPLANNIIRLHKGSIAVHSELNKGTEVVILLPLSM